MDILTFLYVFLGTCALFVVAIACLSLVLARRLDHRWTKVFWLFSLLLAFINFRIWTTAEFDDRFGLGVLLAMSFSLASILFFAISSFVRTPAVYVSPPLEPSLAVSRGRLSASDVAFGLLAGAIFPIVFLFWFGALARASGLWIFVVLALIALCAAGLALVHGRLQTGYALAFWAVLSATLAGSLIYAYKGARDIAGIAAATAAGNPYCVQSGDKPVETVFDLSILTLRQNPHRSGGYLGYHAVLVIDRAGERTILNWSYRAHEFRDNSPIRGGAGSAGPKVFCRPVADGGISLS